MKNRDIIICSVIYLATFAFILHYNLVNPLVNDRVYEYHEYLANIDVGWQYRNSLLNSCIIPTWFPAMIQRLTGWDAMLVFKTLPPFIYALLPVFVYLIAKRYLDKKYAVVSALVVIFSSCILFFPDMGRVGMALGFMSGMVWALLERKLVLAVVFTILVVFSHYSTTVIAVGITGVVFAVILLQNRFKLKQCYSVIKPYLITLCVLIALTGVWHFGIAKYSGDSMFSTLLQPEEAKAIMGEDWGQFHIEDIEDRDMVAQKAFGATIANEPTPAKIEIGANWTVVAFLTLGLWLTFRNRKLVDKPLFIMSIALYGLIVATVVIPQISQYYGTTRMFFTTLMVLAIYFSIGIKWTANKFRLSPLILLIVVLGLYALSTSGLIYLPFGLAKLLPVAVAFP